jgi:hypothetical protein
MKKENDLNVNFKDMFSNKQELTKIFNHIEQDQFETEEILSTYEKDDNRHGVIFTTRETETGKMQKIIIDAIYGEPNSTQVKELTYDIGTGCDKKIILYTLGYSGFVKNEYWYENEMTERFAKIINGCGVETFIVEVFLISDKNCIYNVNLCPDGKRSKFHKELPTKFEFEYAEFHVFYNYTIDWDYDYVERPDDWFSATWCIEEKSIEFQYPVWNEEGLFVKGIPWYKKGYDNLEWLLDNRLDLIKKFFTGHEIIFQESVSGKRFLSIKLWDKPFSIFPKASSKEKEEIVEAIRGYDGVISEFWQSVFHCSDDEIIKLLDCIPEFPFMDLEKVIST